MCLADRAWDIRLHGYMWYRVRQIIHTLTRRRLPQACKTQPGTWDGMNSGCNYDHSLIDCLKQMVRSLSFRLWVVKLPFGFQNLAPGKCTRALLGTYSHELKRVHSVTEETACTYTLLQHDSTCLCSQHSKLAHLGRHSDALEGWGPRATRLLHAGRHWSLLYTLHQTAVWYTIPSWYCSSILVQSDFQGRPLWCGTWKWHLGISRQLESCRLSGLLTGFLSSQIVCMSPENRLLLYTEMPGVSYGVLMNTNICYACVAN